MKVRINIFSLLLVAVIFSASFFLSCSEWFEPSITSLTITNGLDNNSQPKDTCNLFYIDSPQICCSVKLEKAHKHTALTIRWVLVNGDLSKEDNPLIHEDSIYRDTDGDAGFILTPSLNGFTRGEYRADILIDGKIKASSSFYIQKDASGALPQIATFTLSPSIITAGQQATLRWQVSGATRIYIIPSLNKVDTAGNIKITPAADTTYTLHAINRSGNSSSAISIKVVPAVTARADLEVTEFWPTGNVLFYRIRNNGNLASCPTFSAMYKNDVQESKDYTAPLAPGEERVESFASYHFSPRFAIAGSTLSEEGVSDAINIRICVNQPVSCDETTFENNCFEHNYGPLLTINLLRHISSAVWENNRGPVGWPMTMDSGTGWAMMGTAHTQAGDFPNTLLLHPGTDKGSWIQAAIGIPRGNPSSLQYFTVPSKSRLTGMVGITDDSPEGASAKITIGIKQGDKVDFFNPVTVKSRSKLENYEVDLSKFAGKQVQFVVRVDSGVTLQEGSVAWIDPVLSQDK